MQKPKIEELYFVEKKPIAWAQFKNLFEKILNTLEPL